MGAMSSQITSITTVYSTVYSGADRRKHQSSALLAFVRRIHRWPMYFIFISRQQVSHETSWHGSFFRITGPFWGKSINEFLSQRTNNGGDVSFAADLSKRLTKQSNCRLFETPQHWCDIPIMFFPNLQCPFIRSHGHLRGVMIIYLCPLENDIFFIWTESSLLMIIPFNPLRPSDAYMRR